MRRALCSFIVLLWLAAPAYGLLIETPLADPTQEAVAQASFKALKCVVCEGQSLADSDANFAAQMRAEIRRMAGEGQSEAQILDYFRAHYGTRILLDPPMQADTALLFFAPFAVLLLGGFSLYRFTQRRQR